MFHDIQLPDDIERGATGGPRFRTTINEFQSGREQRQADWIVARHEWDLSYGVQRKQDVSGDGYALIKRFFMARQGRLHTFRFKDWSDFHSGINAADEVQIAVGDGLNRRFQIIKLYTDAAGTYSRPILRPIESTLVVRVGGVLQTLGVDYALRDKGTIEFLVNPPLAALPITAAYEFDNEVRFANDDLPIELELENAGRVPDIPVREVRGIDLVDTVGASKVNAYAVLVPGLNVTKLTAYAVLGP